MSARAHAHALEELLGEVRACRLCAAHLPHGPRPVLRARAGARLLIVGQAPGTRVHQTGIPWNDASGDRLRDWLGLDRDQFYDDRAVAIVPIGFCYPGRDANGGDLPPRAECAPLWHARLGAELGAVELVLLVGGYAQRYYLGARAGGSVTDTVRAWRDHLPRFIPTPHPSWRTRAWVRRNPWFETDLLPFLRRRVAEVLGHAQAAVSTPTRRARSPAGPCPGSRSRR